MAAPYAGPEIWSPLQRFLNPIIPFRGAVARPQILTNEADQARNSFIREFRSNLPVMPKVFGQDLQAAQNEQASREAMFAEVMQNYMKAKQSGMQLPPFSEVWKQIQNMLALQKIQEMTDRIQPLSMMEERKFRPIERIPLPQWGD